MLLIDGRVVDLRHRIGSEDLIPLIKLLRPIILDKKELDDLRYLSFADHDQLDQLGGSS
jgi:hypothetical protein